MGIFKKINTAWNLYKQYGSIGLYKGICNKIKKKEVLEGFQDSGYAINPSLFDAMKYLLSEPHLYSDETKYSCTIIIPIYNGLDRLKSFFSSILENTPDYVEVILINDCSSDPRVKAFIQNYLDQYPNWTLIENKKKIGVARSINLGMEFVHTEYAVWLNTDILVSRNWIPKLITPFLDNERIAATSPFTNWDAHHAFPQFSDNNQIKRKLESINEALDYVVSNEYGLNETHSAKAFCMGINVTCWKQIGKLSYEDVGKEYEEVNSWCFRALNNGWKHLLVPNLFVYRFEDGCTLSEEKRNLHEEASMVLQKSCFGILNKKKPSLQADDPWKAYRMAAILKMYKKGVTVCVDFKFKRDDISGALDYLNKVIDELQEKEDELIIVQYERCTNKWSVVPYSVNPNMEIPLDDVMDLGLLFDLIRIDQVIVNNLAFCENVEKAVTVFTKLRKSKEFKLIYKFHDHLSVCPSFFLIDSNHKPCDPMGKNCKDCIRSAPIKAARQNDITAWRRVFDDFFHVVDHCQFFSNYTKNIVCKVYPQVESKSDVQYHKPLFTGKESTFIQPVYKGQWNVGFVGSFCMEKGSEYYLAMKEKFLESSIRSQFVVIGENNTGIQLKDIVIRGRYHRDELGKLLTENEIHFVLFPSIANETFSYVAQELMLLNVPFVVFPCGAPQERIKAENYRLAKIANEVSVESLYEATDQLVKDVYHMPLC